ncbi:hypothetical protein DERF_010924 [Dermatophagoides farinae]|uniref:Uncharacterized protein n=1 Tax=Dermatophagoides farinae TaxID=6954 RepID=A0A922L158_DERFA|nr:hypothetical protein DERF_010924 [Dermatophagoides farinae]
MNKRLSAIEHNNPSFIHRCAFAQIKIQSIRIKQESNAGPAIIDMAGSINRLLPYGMCSNSTITKWFL